MTIIGEGDGLPDLLVGHRGRTFLIEVKHAPGPRGGTHRSGNKSRGGDGVLTADQLAWWSAWRGAPPVIVRTPEEALAAIGVVPNLDPQCQRSPGTRSRSVNQGESSTRHLD